MKRLSAKMIPCIGSCASLQHQGNKISQAGAAQILQCHVHQILLALVIVELNKAGLDGVPQFVCNV